MRSDRSGGFTLLELIVVIAILATLGSVVAFGLLGLVRQSGERPGQAAIALLTWARSEAVAHGERVCIRPGRNRRARIRRSSGTERDTVLEARSELATGSGDTAGFVLPARPVCFDASGTANAAEWRWVEGRDTVTLTVEPWDATAAIR